ncbi:MAG: shikimate kinase [Magnetococcales bacterium]|nr:shikimate kinase [Magnetococcales bacterium]
MNIVLIGPRGVGKSSVCRALSRLSRRPVLSTDLLICYENQGRSIPEILRESHGDWRRFRDLEFVVVEKVSCLDEMIIDAGGGVVVDLDADGNEIYSERKINALKRRGHVVHLTGDPVRLAARTAWDSNRPALSGVHSEEAIMRRREPWYRRAADVTLDTTHARRLELAQYILNHLPASLSSSL